MYYVDIILYVRSGAAHVLCDRYRYVILIRLSGTLSGGRATSAPHSLSGGNRADSQLVQLIPTTHL